MFNCICKGYPFVLDHEDRMYRFMMIAEEHYLTQQMTLG